MSSPMRPKTPTGAPTIILTGGLRIADVSTEETLYLMLPKCKVMKISSVLTGAIITADAVIDAYKDAVDLTGGKITITQVGSATGDIDSCKPSALNEFNGVNEYCKIINVGASGNVVPVLLTIEAEIQDVNMPTSNPTGPPTIIGIAVVRMADLDTLETLYMMLPKCKIIKIFSCLGGATITEADAVITCSKNAVAMTDKDSASIITIATAAAAAGDIDSFTPIAGNTFDGLTDYLKLAGDGGPTAGSPALFTVVYQLL